MCFPMAGACPMTSGGVLEAPSGFADGAPISGDGGGGDCGDGGGDCN